MTDDLKDIREVAEGNRHLANFLLDYDYRLLDVTTTTVDKETPNGGMYAAKRVTYVMGRPEGVARAPRMSEVAG